MTEYGTAAPRHEVVAGQASLPDRRRTVALGDYAEITKGVSYKGAHLNRPGPLLLGLGEFLPGGGAKLDGVRTYSGEYRERHIARPGDLLVALTDLTQSGAVLGSPMIVPTTAGEFCLYTHHVGRVALREPQRLDASFLRYVLQGFQFSAFVAGRSTGTTVRAVHPREVAQFEFAIPPLDEQRAIARILGALDDKIELNRRMSATLEAMARALFKSWFVDFEPVRAKAEGRSSGLPPALDALFPASFEASELGEIPSGWGVGTLGSLCEKPQYGYTQSAKTEPIGPKFLRITDINKRAWVEWESVPHCEISASDFTKYRLHDGDVLIARMADPGHGCMIEGEHDAVFASYLIRFRPLHPRFARFLQYWLRSDDYWELVSGRGAGTTRVSLNAKVLRDFPLLVPPDPLLEAFGSQVGGLRDRVVANADESRTLAAQRDTLLPRLVSGEVRVGSEVKLHATDV